MKFGKREWELVKPRTPYKTIVWKYEKAAKPTYDKEPRTVKEHTGKVVGICICTISGKVLSLAKGIHASVCAHYGVDPEEVSKTGWELDNGNFVWR